MQKINPRGCFGNPGICLKCAQGQKRLKGLPRATHCTDPAQTSGNVSPTVELCPPHPTFGTKVRARRDVPEGKKEITIIHTHITSTTTQLPNMSFDLKFIELTADVLEIYVKYRTYVSNNVDVRTEKQKARNTGHRC